MKDKAGELDFLNELTRLNNELLNTQRTLVKQNSEINHLNTRLTSLNADLEQFTYIASHDLREPLRMVRNFMELLKKKYGEQLDRRANSYIDFAIDGSKRMQDMVSAVLELSRVGHTNALKELMHFEDLIGEAKSNLQLLIQESGAVINIQSRLPALNGYRSDIIRLFQNLLSNSIKFKSTGIRPVVSVGALERKDDWEFTIRDNGIGISKDDSAKIFEIFGRAQTTEKYDGTGIGLAICRKIVENHGGTIVVESKEGEGSTFRFTILKS